jgi:hypothetical protein
LIHVLREVHDTPEEVAAVLRVAGGVNYFGEPIYRAMWGWNRLDWIGGKFEDRDEHGLLVREFIGLRYEPKYTPRNRWHIERWIPPEQYGSPQAWAAQTLEIDGAQNIPALGPYPDRGDWEHCFTLEGPQGEFLQLTPAAARHIAGAIEYGRAFTDAERGAAIRRSKDREELEYDKFADEVLSS